jgi:hypothetical protein
MAITLERYQDEALPEEFIYPAIEALDYISDLQIPELDNSIDSHEIFNDYQFGQVFAAVVETLGDVSPRSAGYQQLSGSDGKERFLASYYPERPYGDDGKSIMPGIFHAHITRVASFTEPNYTIPITISMESGVPNVVRNMRAEHGRLELGQPMGPVESMAEVRHLAALMSAAIRTGQTDPYV